MVLEGFFPVIVQRMQGAKLDTLLGTVELLKLSAAVSLFNSSLRTQTYFRPD